MKNLIAAVAVIAASAAFAADPKPADHRKVSIYLPAADLKWMPMDPAHPDGPQLALATGDAKKGPVAMFMKFPAGFDSGWHVHKNWYVGTVIKGTLTSQGQGDAAAKELPVGSFFSEPGMKNHKNTCLAGSECMIFGYLEKGHDFEPRGEDGKKLAAAPAKKDEGKAAAAPGTEKKADAPGQAKKDEGKKDAAPGQAKKEEAPPKK
jgi:Domain of unknown function (DUF4437)